MSSSRNSSHHGRPRENAVNSVPPSRLPEVKKLSREDTEGVPACLENHLSRLALALHPSQTSHLMQSCQGLLFPSLSRYLRSAGPATKSERDREAARRERDWEAAVGRVRHILVDCLMSEETERRGIWLSAEGQGLHDAGSGEESERRQLLEVLTSATLRNFVCGEEPHASIPPSSSASFSGGGVAADEDNSGGDDEDPFLMPGLEDVTLAQPWCVVTQQRPQGDDSSMYSSSSSCSVRRFFSQRLDEVVTAWSELTCCTGQPSSAAAGTKRRRNSSEEEADDESQRPFTFTSLSSPNTEKQQDTFFALFPEGLARSAAASHLQTMLLKGSRHHRTSGITASTSGSDAERLFFFSPSPSLTHRRFSVLRDSQLPQYYHRLHRLQHHHHHHHHHHRHQEQQQQPGRASPFLLIEIKAVVRVTLQQAPSTDSGASEEEEDLGTELGFAKAVWRWRQSGSLSPRFLQRLLNDAGMRMLCGSPNFAASDLQEASNSNSNSGSSPFSRDTQSFCSSPFYEYETKGMLDQDDDDDDDEDEDDDDDDDDDDGSEEAEEDEEPSDISRERMNQINNELLKESVKTAASSSALLTAKEGGDIRVVPLAFSVTANVAGGDAAAGAQHGREKSMDLTVTTLVKAESAVRPPPGSSASKGSQPPVMVVPDELIAEVGFAYLFPKQFLMSERLVSLCVRDSYLSGARPGSWTAVPIHVAPLAPPPSMVPLTSRKAVGAAVEKKGEKAKFKAGRGGAAATVGRGAVRGRGAASHRGGPNHSHYSSRGEEGRKGDEREGDAGTTRSPGEDAVDDDDDEGGAAEATEEWTWVYASESSALMEVVASIEAAVGSRSATLSAYRREYYDSALKQSPLEASSSLQPPPFMLASSSLPCITTTATAVAVPAAAGATSTSTPAATATGSPPLTALSAPQPTALPPHVWRYRKATQKLLERYYFAKLRCLYPGMIKCAMMYAPLSSATTAAGEEGAGNGGDMTAMVWERVAAILHRLEQRLHETGNSHNEKSNNSSTTEHGEVMVLGAPPPTSASATHHSTSSYGLRGGRTFNSNNKKTSTSTSKAGALTCGAAVISSISSMEQLVVVWRGRRRSGHPDTAPQQPEEDEAAAPATEGSTHEDHENGGAEEEVGNTEEEEEKSPTAPEAPLAPPSIFADLTQAVADTEAELRAFLDLLQVDAEWVREAMGHSLLEQVWGLEMMSPLARLLLATQEEMDRKLVTLTYSTPRDAAPPHGGVSSTSEASKKRTEQSPVLPRDDNDDDDVEDKQERVYHTSKHSPSPPPTSRSEECGDKSHKETAKNKNKKRSIQPPHIGVEPAAEERDEEEEPQEEQKGVEASDTAAKPDKANTSAAVATTAGATLDTSSKKRHPRKQQQQQKAAASPSSSSSTSSTNKKKKHGRWRSAVSSATTVGLQWQQRLPQLPHVPLPPNRYCAMIFVVVMWLLGVFSVLRSLSGAE